MTSMIWSEDDRQLVTCSDDGSLYEWDITGKRTGENVNKECSYNDVSLSNADGVVYAVGSDKTVKQFVGSKLVREVDLHTFVLSAVVVSNDGRMVRRNRFFFSWALQCQT